MTRKLQSVALRYGLPLVSFALILLLAAGLERRFSVRLDPSILIIALLIASAWYGGRGSGLLVAFLFEITIDYFYLAGQPFTWRYAIIIFNRSALFLALTFFASSRRSAERRLRQQREWLRVALSSIGDAVIATDLKGTVNFINPTAEAITGWTLDEVTSKPLGEVFHLIDETTRDPVENPFSAIKRKGQVVGLANHTLLLARDGREIPIEDSGAPIKDQAGKTIGVIIVFHDVSERRRADKEREQLLEREQAARSEAEAASRLKDEFLATVSHELRTPLNAILGWASLLNHKRLDEATMREATAVIERNAKGQAEIINDILDVSRIITGKLRIEPQAVELAPIIQASIDTVYPAAVAKSITLKLALDPNAGLALADPARLQQIIWNLLSNAIKFTPAGGSIEVQLERSATQVVITVSDSGIGIDRQFLPYVFDRFRQADSSTTRAHGGLGLGLAIVRHLVELHGGAVSVESTGAGHGAVFTVRLPMAVETPTPSYEAAPLRLERMAGANDSSTGSTDLRGLRVLVVDDDTDTREILCLALSQYGAEVRAAGSSTAALDAFRQWKPDILISDLGMPGEDGFELIGKVRSLTPEEGGTIPAAALTAYVGEEDQVRARSAGYQLHIAKPVDPAKLAALVADLTMQAK